MNERFLRAASLIALLLGACAASSNWLWAKGFITLWLLLSALSFLSPKTQVNLGLNSLQNALSFFALALAICGAGLAFANPLHGFLIGVIWLSLIAYSTILWKQDRQTLNPLDPIWPSKFYAVFFVLLFGGGTLAGFWLLGFLLHRPSEENWGTSLTWAALGFIVAYPKTIAREFSPLEKSAWKWATPFIIVGVLVFHFFQYRSIQSQLRANNQTGILPGVAAENALRHGYLGLGIEGILQETNRLFHEKNWKDAVNYHRGMWRDVDKDRLARAYLNHADLEKNLFLYTTCYGCNLTLNSSEQAVDFGGSPAINSFLVLTSQGRLLRLGTNGVECIHQEKENPAAMALAYQSGTAVILHASGFVNVIRDSKKPVTFVLPPFHVWKDIAINPQGSTVWTMDVNGKIDETTFNPNTESWDYQKESHLPLWSEPDIAKSFIPANRENTFFVLDRANGIHWRGDPPLPDNSSLKNELLAYYNPQRQVAAALEYWQPFSSVMMMEQTGRILFVPIPDFSNPNASIAELASASATIPAPVDSLLTFEQSQSTWQRKMETVAVAALPEANTIVELQRHGTLQAIAMPQRFHICFVHPETYRFSTDVSLAPDPSRQSNQESNPQSSSQ